MADRTLVKMGELSSHARCRMGQLHRLLEPHLEFVREGAAIGMWAKRENVLLRVYQDGAWHDSAPSQPAETAKP